MIGIDKEVCDVPVIVPLLGGTPAQQPKAYGLAPPADHLPLGMRQLLVMAAFKSFMVLNSEAAKAAGDPTLTMQASDDRFEIVTPSTADVAKIIDFIVKNAFVP